MHIITVVSVFILGLCFGSFTNVLIHRIPRGESIVFPSSHCPFCSMAVPWWGNIPIVGYTILKGRCHYCGVPISRRYPLVEFLGGCITLLCVLKWGFAVESYVWFVSLMVLLAVALIDLDTMIIPDSLLVVLVLCAAAHMLLQPSISNVSLHFGAGLVGSGIVLMLIFLSGGGMGFGDVKLVGALGLLLGPAYLVLGFFCATVIGAFIALTLLLFGKKGRKDPIPFGPFLAIGSYISIFAGDPIIQWYRLSFTI